MSSRKASLICRIIREYVVIKRWQMYREGEIMLRIDLNTAEDIVNFIYAESNFHAIICDENGKIIADTAKTRLGIVHEGSRRILTTNIDRMVITNEDVEKMGGKVKAGTNIAIKDGDTKIGNFGITGDPQYTESLANIAKGLVISRLRDKESKAILQKCSADVASSLERAATTIQQLSATSQQLASSSQRATAVTSDVNQSIKDTYDILQFIQQVANQTNLLGLNAAIEAARAGEHGRGFAVVAEEIRKLSNDSKNSTASINDILNKLRASIDIVIKVSEENNSVAHEQACAIQQMASMIEDVHRIGLELVQVSTKH
jgi:sugar diacid utilization regulator